ncbi:MAG: hypothetical protein ACM3OF_04580 [Gemmatimonas sp.]|jgi:hypothetical protein
MKFVDSTDESLLAYYESVRRQVVADNRLGGRYRLIGASVREYADQLQHEMSRRQLPFKPIDWPGAATAASSSWLFK